MSKVKNWYGKRSPGFQATVIMVGWIAAFVLFIAIFGVIAVLLGPVVFVCVIAGLFVSLIIGIIWDGIRSDIESNREAEEWARRWHPSDDTLNAQGQDGSITR